MVHPTGVVLDQGAYSDVLEVIYKMKLYAAKKYRMVNQVRENLCREHEILARIRHPNIVPYYGICKLASDKSTVIVMERTDMDLTKFLREKPDINLSVKSHILHDIAKGLHHLHSQDPAIIHRDLTAGNVLLNRNGVAKISDFGNSRIVDLHGTPEILTSSPGTLDYMPPEALGGGEYYDNRLDVFSYGHLAIYIIINSRPHPLKSSTYTRHGSLIPRSEFERREKYLKQVSTALEGGVKHPLYLMIVKCLENEPNNRPSCEEIISNGVRSGIFK